MDLVDVIINAVVTGIVLAFSLVLACVSILGGIAWAVWRRLR